MKLLSYVQTLNNTLGIVETGRSLVTRQGAGHSSVSALSQQIETVGAALTSEVRGARDVLQQDIRTVSHMVSEVSTQQEVLRREIHQVIEGVAGLNVLMKKHMKSVEEQLRFLVEEPMQNACYQLTAHLINREGVGATDEEIRAWLRTLESWISKAATRKTITMTSEEAVQILSQSPDNIGFIAARLRSLFGDMIPETFLSLPSVSIKFYFTVIKLYLNGLEKHPHLLGTDKAASICQEIQNTFALYLEFSKFLNNNPHIVQALFDQHPYQLTRNKLLAQEQHVLLKNLQPLIGKETFDSKLASLERSLTQPVVVINSTVDIWDSLPTQPHERVKKLFALLSQDTAPMVARTKYMLLAEGAAYTPIPSQINWAPLGAPDGSSTSYWGCSYFPHQPKQPTFVSVSVLFLLLASGYADTNFFRNSTLKKQVTQLIASCPSTTGSYSTETNREWWEVDSCHDSNWAIVYANPRYGDRASYTSGEFRFLFGNSAHMVNVTHHPAKYSTTSYTPNHSIYSGHRANIFEYHAKLTDELPKDYEAILKHNAQSDIDTYKLLFKFYVMHSQGRIKEADTFIRQQTFAQEFQKSYFLFMVAILGRWDIFEAFNKIHPVSNYSWTFRDTAITPLMLAEQHGHQDVVIGLKAKSSTPALLQRAVAPDVSEYTQALEGILRGVSASKTTLGQYVPTPPAQQVAASERGEPLPDPVTDDEQEECLNHDISEFFAKRTMHAGTKTFVTKPLTRPYNRTGHRTITNSFFAGDNRLRADLHRYLETEKHFTVSKEGKLDDQLLFVLPLGRH